MSATQIRGRTQIKPQSIDLVKMALDFLAASDWNVTNGGNNATLVGLKDAVDLTSPATLGQLNAAVAGLAGGLSYKGNLDAAAGLAALNDGQQGDFYVVSVAGTVAGTPVSVGDHVFLNKNVVGAPAAGDVEFVDNSEALDIVRTSMIVAALNSTDDTKVLAASQGKLLQDQIALLQGAAWIEVTGEELAVTNGSAVLPALTNAPLAGSEKVYHNGIRLFRGVGEDYTIDNATGIITMEYPLNAGDRIVVDYNR